MLATQKGRSNPVRISSRRWPKLISPSDAIAAIVLEAGKEASNGVGTSREIRRRIARQIGGCRARTTCCCVAGTLLCWYDCRHWTKERAGAGGYQKIGPRLSGGLFERRS